MIRISAVRIINQTYQVVFPVAKYSLYFLAKFLKKIWPLSNGE